MQSSGRGSSSKGPDDPSAEVEQPLDLRDHHKMVQSAYPLARRAGMVLVALAVAAGCRSHDDTDSSARSVSTGATSSTVPTTAPGTTAVTSPGATTRPPVPTTSTTPTPPSAIAISEADAGKTFTLRRGDHLTVVLHSTYWSFTSPPSKVMTPDGPASVAPDLGGCVPGGGCGTVTIGYRADAAGSATLSAHRDSCGEARACTDGQGDWHVTVTVAR
jgi:hypothetical protein